ncbi:hypothetical protein [Natronorubrum aibiense]|uniref:Uncharacterized protein n=1 Tax=Natronorubrum aibiense TaxID=348826 RepID=A0A5P9P0P0_9EURY|nr:hypothetical protein [Natronorubrum aibiense]QFU81719.1 hypothetical protein GCU68_03660 [Natronorubrum aibiense]
MKHMLDARESDAFRPAPVPEEWHPHSSAGVVGIRIAAMEDEQPSAAAWIWSSKWLDLTAKR